MKILFRSELEWKEGKKGEIFCPSRPSLTVSTPPEFKGPPGYWSPEELFLASIDSCIMTTFLYFAEKMGLVFSSYKSQIQGEVNLREGRLLFTSIVVNPTIKVKDGLNEEKAKICIEKAEKYCLISSSIGVKVTLLPKILKGD